MLITSQSALWPSSQALNVPLLDPQAAADFLVTRTGDPDQQAALGLASELGWLPLALEQAAAYIQASGDSLAGYLALFRRRRTEMLERGEPTGHSKTVATTWRLTFEHLRQAAPGAVGLLRLLANCASEAIPLPLLLQPRPGLEHRLGAEVAPDLVPLLKDELVVRDAIAALRRYSLMSPLSDGAVSVHRLVQTITVAQMPAELAAAWRQAAAAVIEAALPADPRSPETWPVFASLLPHVQAASTDNSSGMWRAASYLGYSGSYAAARDLQQRVLDTQVRVSGPEHPDTLPARGDLARWTGEAGDAAGARDQFAALLPVVERVSRRGAPAHPDRPRQPRPLDRGGGGRGRGPGPVRRAAAGRRAGPRRGAPAYPGRARQPRPLDRGGGGCGRGPGPVRRAAAGTKSGSWAPSTRAPCAFATISPTGPGRRGTRRGARDQFAALLPVRERVSAPSTRTP